MACFSNFCYFGVFETNNNIFWLEVRVNNLAHTVHVVESDEALPCQLASKGNWNALIIIALNDLKEINSKNLEDHNKVFAIRSVVDE